MVAYLKGISMVSFLRYCRFMIFLSAIMLMATSIVPAFAQETNVQPSTSITESNDVYGSKNIDGFERIVSSFEFWLSIMVIIFTILILFAEFYLFSKADHIKFRPDDILRVIITTIIVCGTLFFLAAGFSSEQIAPAIGLFGTVVGYLLGSTDARRLKLGGGENDQADDKRSEG